MSRKQRPRNAAEGPKAKRQKLQKPLLRPLSRRRRPRTEGEAQERLKQLAREARDIQEEILEGFRPVAETARHAVPIWIKPWIASPDLLNYFADAVDDYTLEKPTRRKPRARSMDVALGLKRRQGPPKGTQRDRLPTAIHIHYLLLLGETWDGIADRYQIDVRTVRRIYKTHADGIVEHLSGDYFVPLGYDLKDRNLIVNKSEVATVRMIFERFAKIGSATKLMLALKAEGITGKRGKPIDEGYLYRLLNNRIYVGEAVHKGMYPGQHEAIVTRALWNRVHRIRRVKRLPLAAPASRGVKKPDNDAHPGDAANRRGS